MEDFIIIAIVVLILILAVGYIINEKRKGNKCIGCPNAKECSSKNSCRK